MHLHTTVLLPYRLAYNLGWQPLHHAAESRYAPVKGEALAVADALDKTRFFVVGCHNLIIAVDHKPLLKIFGDRSLEDIPNTRLRNLKERTLRYKFAMVHVPGIQHKAADAVSRHPTGPPDMLVLQDDIASTGDSSIPFLLTKHGCCILSGIRCTTKPNYFHYKGVHYLVLVDRYSNWPIIERAQDGSKGLITCI